MPLVSSGRRDRRAACRLSAQNLRTLLQRGDCGLASRLCCSVSANVDGDAMECTSLALAAAWQLYRHLPLEQLRSATDRVVQPFLGGPPLADVLVWASENCYMSFDVSDAEHAMERESVLLDHLVAASRALMGLTTVDGSVNTLLSRTRERRERDLAVLWSHFFACLVPVPGHQLHACFYLIICSSRSEPCGSWPRAVQVWCYRRA